jgi:aspartate aminotransferase
MLDAVRPLPPDAILGLIGAYQRDLNPDKIDLGAGVYRNSDGETPIVAAVRTAEQRLFASERTKSYVAPPGDPAFIAGVTRLLFGADHPVLTDARVGAVQSPGGCGALRLGAELINRLRPGTPMWVSTPTWPNHEPLLGQDIESMVSQVGRLKPIPDGPNEQRDEMFQRLRIAFERAVREERREGRG